MPARRAPVAAARAGDREVALRSTGRLVPPSGPVGASAPARECYRRRVHTVARSVLAWVATVALGCAAPTAAPAVPPSSPPPGTGLREAVVAAGDDPEKLRALLADAAAIPGDARAAAAEDLARGLALGSVPRSARSAGLHTLGALDGAKADRTTEALLSRAVAGCAGEDVALLARFAKGRTGLERAVLEARIELVDHCDRFETNREPEIAALRALDAALEDVELARHLAWLERAFARKGIPCVVLELATQQRSPEMSRLWLELWRHGDERRRSLLPMGVVGRDALPLLTAAVERREPGWMIAATHLAWMGFAESEPPLFAAFERAKDPALREELLGLLTLLPATDRAKRAFRAHFDRLPSDHRRDRGTLTRATLAKQLLAWNDPSLVPWLLHHTAALRRRATYAKDGSVFLRDTYVEVAIALMRKEHVASVEREVLRDGDEKERAGFAAAKAVVEACDEDLACHLGRLTSGTTEAERRHAGWRVVRLGTRETLKAVPTDEALEDVRWGLTRRVAPDDRPALVAGAAMQRRKSCGEW